MRAKLALAIALLGLVATSTTTSLSAHHAFAAEFDANKPVKFEGTVVELKNGRKAAQGTCPKCGTKVMRILGKADA